MGAEDTTDGEDAEAEAGAAGGDEASRDDNRGENGGGEEEEDDGDEDEAGVEGGGEGGAAAGEDVEAEAGAAGGDEAHRNDARDENGGGEEEEDEGDEEDEEDEDEAGVEGGGDGGAAARPPAPVPRPRVPSPAGLPIAARQPARPNVNRDQAFLGFNSAAAAADPRANGAIMQAQYTFLRFLRGRYNAWWRATRYSNNGTRQDHSYVDPRGEIRVYSHADMRRVVAIMERDHVSAAAAARQEHIPHAGNTIIPRHLFR
jgi:hypothetical protein